MMMRKLLATLFLLGTIVLFSAAGSNPVMDSGGPEPPCFPCTVQ